VHHVKISTSREKNTEINLKKNKFEFHDEFFFAFIVMAAMYFFCTKVKEHLRFVWPNHVLQHWVSFMVNK